MQFSQKIAPCLWFDSQGEEAANFYVGIFRNSKIQSDLALRKSRPGDSPASRKARS